MTVLSGGGEIASKSCVFFQLSAENPFEGWPKAQRIRNPQAAVKRNKTFEIFERRRREK